MNKYKRKKIIERNKKLEQEIKTYRDLEEKIYCIESLKLCTQSNVYKKHIDNQIKNIIKWWKSKGNCYKET